jgi:hypothetical protein
MIQKSTHAVPRLDLGEAFHEFSAEDMRFIAMDILPRKKMGKKAATLSVTKRKNLTIPETKHANGATYGRIEWYMDDLAYACVNHGLEGQVTDEDVENYGGDFDAELEKTWGIKLKMQFAREKRVKELIFNTTTWTGSALYTDNSAAPWDNIASDIIGQLRAGKEKVRANTGRMPKSLIIGENSLNNMLKNTALIARFPGIPILTESIFRSRMNELIGIENLLVGQAVYNTADEGQDFSGGDIWPDDYAMLAVTGTETTPMVLGHLGRTIIWDQYTSDIEYMESYREEQTESEIIRCKEYIDEKVFDVYFGHLLKIDA